MIINATITNIIMLLLGLFLCLYGNRLRNIMTVIIWFLIGFNISNNILISTVDNQTILLIINVVIGIVTGSLGIKLEKISVFIAVSYITYELLKSYTFIDTQILNTVIKLGISILIGSLSLFMIKTIFILATSIYGASLVYQSLPILVPLVSPIIGPLVLVIMILTIIIQYKIS